MTIEDMSLEALKDNLTELSDEEILEYIQGTRNNRLKKAVPKTKKKKSSSTEPEDQLVDLLAALGPDAIKLLEGMMEEEE